MKKEYALPERDKILFEEMHGNYISDNEAIFFERMKEKELYDSNDEQDDLLWDRERPDAYSIYRIYRHWYMVSIPKNNETDCDEFEYACLADMLNDDFAGHEDYEQLDIKGKTNLDILRDMDYRGVVYDN